MLALPLGFMKTCQRRSTSRTRPLWWLRLSPLLVIWSLVLAPAHLCLFFESGTAHSHTHSHTATSAHSHSTTDHHAAEGDTANRDAGGHHADTNPTGSHDADSHDAGGHDADGHDGLENHADEAGGSQQAPHSMALLPVPEEETCCSSGAAPIAIAAHASRLTVPTEHCLDGTFAPATLPVTSDVFALTHCHGRDGPPAALRRSQFLPSSLLGRAPPVSV